LCKCRNHTEENDQEDPQNCFHLRWLY
jgi:hypothetical protein